MFRMLSDSVSYLSIAEHQELRMSLRSLEDASEAASRDKSNNAPVATTTTTTTTSAAGIEYEAPST